MTDIEKLEAFRRQIQHAQANGHHLAGDCQGIGFNRQPPDALRVDYLLGILDE